MAFLGPIGTPELIIIMVVLLLVFGARRLPEMGRSMGKGMREFKDAISGEETASPSAPVELPTAPSESSATAEQPEDVPAEKPERETVS
jgi:TatA/E family protein of Tat protein translocase